MSAIVWRIVAIVGLVVSAYAVILWYGNKQFKVGYAKSQAQAQAVQAALESAMQAEKDQVDANYRGAVLARDYAQSELADVRARLERLLHSHASRPKTAGTCLGPNDAGEDWIGIFGRVIAEYERVGKDAARLADKVNGLQGYVRALGGLSRSGN